jgi:hypothetical protein
MSAQCGCCFEPLSGIPAGLCRGCAEEGSWIQAPLCAKCVVRHTLPGSYKRLASHKFEAQHTPGSSLLEDIGVDPVATDFCKLHVGEPLRFWCLEKSCASALCIQCMPAHRGHAFEDAASVSDTLRQALVSRLFLTPCWGSTSAPSAPSTNSDEFVALLDNAPLSSSDLLSRLNATAAVRKDLEATAQAAAARAAAAFDASIAELSARKAALLAHMSSAVASKARELDAEAEVFLAARAKSKWEPAVLSLLCRFDKETCCVCVCVCV